MILFQGINSVSLIINQMRNYPRTGEREIKGSQRRKRKKRKEKLQSANNIMVRGVTAIAENLLDGITFPSLRKYFM